MAIDNETLVKAARELLRWNQARLAKEAGLGIATLRRFETGEPVGEASVRKLFSVLEAAGILFVGGATMEGVDVLAGIGLRRGVRPEARTPNKRPKVEAREAVHGKRLPGRPRASARVAAEERKGVPEAASSVTPVRRSSTTADAASSGSPENRAIDSTSTVSKASERASRTSSRKAKPKRSKPSGPPESQ